MVHTEIMSNTKPKLITKKIIRQHMFTMSDENVNETVKSIDKTQHK